MKKKTLLTIASVFITTITITSCGSETSKETTKTTEITPEEVTEEIIESVAETVISGEELYTEAGCVACHQPDAKVVGPSIKNIAEAYKDNKDGLISFMKGESEAIVDPEQAELMKPQVEITKAMSDEEQIAIADYILNI